MPQSVCSTWFKWVDLRAVENGNLMGLRRLSCRFDIVEEGMLFYAYMTPESVSSLCLALP